MAEELAKKLAIHIGIVVEKNENSPGIRRLRIHSTTTQRTPLDATPAYDKLLLGKWVQFFVDRYGTFYDIDQIIDPAPIPTRFAFFIVEVETIIVSPNQPCSLWPSVDLGLVRMNRKMLHETAYAPPGIRFHCIAHVIGVPVEVDEDHFVVWEVGTILGPIPVDRPGNGDKKKEALLQEEKLAIAVGNHEQQQSTAKQDNYEVPKSFLRETLMVASCPTLPPTTMEHDVPMVAVSFGNEDSCEPSTYEIAAGLLRRVMDHEELRRALCKRDPGLFIEVLKVTQWSGMV